MPALPYDISAIPYFAWIPGREVWLAFIILTVAVALFTRRYLNKKTGARAALDFFALAQTQLEQMALAGQSPKTSLAQLSLIMRRLLAVAIDFPADSLTVHELSRHAAEAKSNATVQIAVLLKNLEQALYGPLPIEPVFVKEALRQAAILVRELKLERAALQQQEKS